MNTKPLTGQDDRLRGLRGVLYVLLMICTLFVMILLFQKTPVGPDLFGHVTFGKEIVETRRIPRVDLYSYTAPGHPWVNHEWLSEVVFALVHHGGGFYAFHLFKLIVLSLLVLLLFRTSVLLTRRPPPAMFYPLLTMALFLLSPFVQVRPQLFSFLLFGCMLYLFLDSLTRSSRALYIIPILFLAWVNLHGGFVAGLLVLPLLTLGTFFLDRSLFKKMIAVVFCSFAVTLLNPYGAGLYRQLYHTLTNPYTAEYIVDWFSILHQPVYAHPAVVGSVVVFLIQSMVTALWASRSPTLLLWTLFCAVIFATGLLHVRNFAFFPLASFPLWALLLNRYYDRDRKVPEPVNLSPDPSESGQLTASRRLFDWIRRLGTGGKGVFLLIVCFMVLSLIGGEVLTNPRGRYPEDAVRFMKRKQLQGNLAVPFNVGQYCIFHLHPRIRVSLDGRYDTVYPLEVFQDFQFTIFEGREGWSDKLKHYDTDYVLVPKRFPLYSLLLRDSQAGLLFQGQHHAVFKLPAVQRSRFEEDRTRTG